MVPRRHRGDRFLCASARGLSTRRQTRLHERRLNGPAAATTRASMKRLLVTRVQAQSTGGMRPDASENSQISPSTIVRAARAAGSHPHLASVLLQGRKSANIHASSGVIWGIGLSWVEFAKLQNKSLILCAPPRAAPTRRGQSEERGSPMTRIVLAALALLVCATFGTEVFAQASQTITPVPLTPPSINTTTTTCQINCDTQAMTCQGTCSAAVAAGTVNLLAPTFGNTCTFNCTNQQLVCKQRC